VIEDEGNRSQLKHSIIPCKGTTYVVVEARSERRCQSSLPGRWPGVGRHLRWLSRI